MFWLYRGNVSPINNHYLSESRRSFEWMLILFLYLCRCIPMFHTCSVDLYPNHENNLFSPTFLYLNWVQEREWGSDSSPSVSQIGVNVLQTEVSIFSKRFICWSASKPCSQWSLGFIKAVARVQEREFRASSLWGGNSFWFALLYRLRKMI